MNNDNNYCEVLLTLNTFFDSFFAAEQTISEIVFKNYLFYCTSVLIKQCKNIFI